MNNPIPTTPHDKNFRSYWNWKDQTVRVDPIHPTDGQTYDDLWKISACRNCVFIGADIIAPMPLHREDGVDVSGLSDGVTLLDFRVAAGGKYAVTIKQVRNIILRNGVITRPGQNWERVDIDLGNRSQYRELKTTGVTIDNVRRADGKPVRVRVGHADWPELKNGVYDVLYAQSIGLKGYVWACARIDARFNAAFLVQRWDRISEADYL